MNITLTDNQDGTFILAEADRETLAAAILITPTFKNGSDTVQYPANTFDNAFITVYDPVSAANAIQAQIDALTASLVPLQATQAYQAATTATASPAQPAQPANPANPAPAQ